MTIWQPGMRCVCVDAGGGADNNPLVAGQVYTVLRKDVQFSFFYDDLDTFVVLILCEVKHPDGDNFGFNAARFRPLLDSRLDQFRVHLAPAPKVREPA